MAARLLISAAHKSSGKTTLSVGLCRALARRGLAVQPFKKGPDYIDPMWLSRAAGRECWNLDFHTQAPEAIRRAFARHAAGAEVALIEGNKGLYDGMAMDGRDSTAGLARLLAAPVVLVLDAQGITRGVAPLLQGYRAFDPAVTIAGVILNKVAGPRHEGKLREVIAHYAPDLPVLGAVHRRPSLHLAERHLGLIPANEAAGAEAAIERFADAVAEQVDLDALLAVAEAAPALAAAPAPAPAIPAPDLRIGVARDAAFGFYYPDDIEALRAAGAEPVFFDTLRDAGLPPDLDGLFIGGGFPETQMAALEGNAAMRAAIAAAVGGGLPTYAECGGLMYLTRAINWQGERRAMVGAIPAETAVHPTPQGRGYVRLAPTAAFPWPDHGPEEQPGHEFHHSALVDLEADPVFAFAVRRGHGIDGRHDGLVIGNLLAGYAHLRSTGPDGWAPRFAAFVRQIKGGARRAV